MVLPITVVCNAGELLAVKIRTLQKQACCYQHGSSKPLSTNTRVCRLQAVLSCELWHEPMGPKQMHSI